MAHAHDEAAFDPETIAAFGVETNVVVMGPGREDEDFFGSDSFGLDMGANLARLEISALLSALVRRVERFELREAERISNNVLRGYKSLKVTAYAAK